MEAVATNGTAFAEPAPDATPDLSVMGVAPGAVAAVWSHIQPMIEASRKAVPAMVAARESPEDIRAKAESGFYQIWMIYEGHDLVAVAVSSVERYTRITACVVQYLAGRAVDEWLDVWVDEIRDWAKANDCQQIECRGRLGWGKKLKPLGAVTAGAAYVMEIE